MENIEIKAKTRTKKGNGPARVLRREGRVPAILYGPATEPIKLHVSAHDLEMTLKSGSLGRSVITVDIDDGKASKKVMVKELQTHPVSHSFLHLDLYEISMDRKIYVNVPIVVTGKAKGVEMGGMLQIIRRELEVLCLPNAIPDNITLDVTDLEIGGSIHVEDIQLEGDIEIVHDVNFTILTITSTRADEKAEEGEETEQAGEEAE